MRINSLEGNRNVSLFFVLEEFLGIKFDKVQFVYIDMEYLKKLNEIESEIFYDAENENYKEKPHLGILLNNEGREYVIPLTSAKENQKMALMMKEYSFILDISDKIEEKASKIYSKK